MSQKIVQLTLPGFENATFDQVAIRMMRGLFKRDSDRQKDIKIISTRLTEIEEIMYQMGKRVNNLSDEEIK